MSRSSFSYNAKEDSLNLIEQIKDVATNNQKWGYRFLLATLRKQGLKINHKKFLRIYRENHLQIRIRPPKPKENRQDRVKSDDNLTDINERWSMDFIHDVLANKRQYRILNVIDDYNRKLLVAGFLCFISSTLLIVLTLLSSFIYHFLWWHLAYAYYFFLAFLYDKKRKRKDGPYQYDAFVSYNAHDEGWVYRELLPVLEGEQHWRLCLHHRDFEPGTDAVPSLVFYFFASSFIEFCFLVIFLQNFLETLTHTHYFLTVCFHTHRVSHLFGGRSELNSFTDSKQMCSSHFLRVISEPNAF